MEELEKIEQLRLIELRDAEMRLGKIDQEAQKLAMAVKLRKE